MRKGFWPFPRIAREGWPLIVATGLVGSVVVLVASPRARLFGVLGLLLSMLFVYFYRDPDRSRPTTDADDLLSPADGTVIEVADVQDEGFGPGRVVRVFLSIFDVHIQRAPAAGEILSIQHTPGRFLRANHRRAHLVNESILIGLQTARGRVAVRSIAGFVARRVVSWVSKGATVGSGDRLGMIHFGSQVDLYVPFGVEIQVRVGDRVTGGRTIVGRFSGIDGG